ncbi:MAG TPA: hypothetical protein PLK94_05860, partial [Alphaproteobacteria bacterium]|nr:hypothetical protein [Alphaproteobacteria bacterium]
LAQMLSSQNEYFYMVDLSDGDEGSILEMNMEQAVGKIVSSITYSVETPPFFFSVEDAQAYLEKFHQESESPEMINRQYYGWHPQIALELIV